MPRSPSPTPPAPGVPVLIPDHDAFVARYPDSASSTAALGLGARAALPLRGSGGDLTGAIVHAWPGPRVFDETLVSTLMTIAEMAGQALERTGLAEAEHHLVTTLQDSVLVPLPAMPHLDIAARYLPAAQDIGMGGDWYEGIALGDDLYALIVGDVAGHGITAVGDMAQLRAVMGALVRIGTPLAEVFAQTTALLQAGAHNPTATATLLLLDTAAATITYAAAGHPPPILRRPDGDCEVLLGARQPILGIPVTDTEVRRGRLPGRLGARGLHRWPHRGSGRGDRRVRRAAARPGGGAGGRPECGGDRRPAPARVPRRPRAR